MTTTPPLPKLRRERPVFAPRSGSPGQGYTQPQGAPSPAPSVACSASSLLQGGSNAMKNEEALAQPSPPEQAASICPTCGSDCNERDELTKAEREIERLNGLLAAPAPLPELSEADVLERCAKWCDEQPRSFSYGRQASDMVRRFAADIAAKKGNAA